jgi:hypothetical protein
LRARSLVGNPPFCLWSHCRSSGTRDLNTTPAIDRQWIDLGQNSAAETEPNFVIKAVSA